MVIGLDKKEGRTELGYKLSMPPKMLRVLQVSFLPVRFCRSSSSSSSSSSSLVVVVVSSSSRSSSQEEEQQ
jgi:hypothetical protein